MGQTTVMENGTVCINDVPVAILEPVVSRLGIARCDEYRLLTLIGGKLGLVRRPFGRERWTIDHERPARHHSREAAIEALLARVAGERGRKSAAEQAFSLYDWGPEKVVSTSIWAHRLQDCLHLTIFLRTPRGEMVERVFKVVFEGPGSSEVKEAFVMTPRED